MRDIESARSRGRGAGWVDRSQPKATATAADCCFVPKETAALDEQLEQLSVIRVLSVSAAVLSRRAGANEARHLERGGSQGGPSRALVREPGRAY